MALLLVATSCLAPEAAWGGLRETIAAKFGVDPSSFVLNLPPRPGCLPGSIFTDDLRVPLSRTRPDDPKLDFGPPFQFDAVAVDAGGQAGVGVSQWLGLSASAGAASGANVHFTGAIVLTPRIAFCCSKSATSRLLRTT